MCKFICIINKNKNNNTLLKGLVAANVSDLSTQRDGYSTYRDGKQSFHMEYRDAEANMEYRGESLYMVHARIKTAGELGEGGLHLQRLHKRFVFMHNGSIHKVMAPDKSDSYHFFNDMIRAYKGVIDEDKVLCDIQDYGFWGRAVLYDEKEDALHFIATTKLYIYMFDECLVFSSYPLTLKSRIGTVHTVLGFPYVTYTSESVTPIHETDVDDAYMRFDHGVFSYMASFPKGYLNRNSPAPLYNGQGQANDDWFKKASGRGKKKRAKWPQEQTDYPEPIRD